MPSGNRVGTDLTGTVSRANRDGIRIVDAPNNTIGSVTGTTLGGACTGGCNLISGNGRWRSDHGDDRVRQPHRLQLCRAERAGTACDQKRGNAILLFNTQQNTIGKPLWIASSCG